MADATVTLDQLVQVPRSAAFQAQLTVEKVGCPGVRFHDLRHAAATLAAHTGASTKDLMARMGHATQQEQKAIAQRMAAQLAPDTNVVPLKRTS